MCELQDRRRRQERRRKRRGNALGPAVALVVMFLRLLAARAETAPPPWVLSGSAVGPLFPHAQGFFDPTLTVDFAQTREPAIAARFAPLRGAVYNKRPVPGALWVRFALKNPRPTRLDRMLVVDYRSIDELDVWLDTAESSWTHYRSGQDVAIADRLYRATTPIFPLSIEPGATLHVVMRFNAEILTAAAELLELPEIMAREKTRHLVCGVIFGLILLVGAYTLYFYVRLRETLYAWLALTSVGMLLFIAFYSIQNLRRESQI